MFGRGSRRMYRVSKAGHGVRRSRAKGANPVTLHCTETQFSPSNNLAALNLSSSTSTTPG